MSANLMGSGGERSTIESEIGEAVGAARKTSGLRRYKTDGESRRLEGAGERRPPEL
jgi:hypothetical protein